jgi:diguanylate cyclase (GGDEF)-like protein
MPIIGVMGMRVPSPVPDGVSEAPVVEATWLTDALGRERLLDMSPRVRALRHLTFLTQGAVLIGCSHWIGWWPTGVMAVVGLVFALSDRWMPRVARPEIVFAFAFVVAQVAITVSAMISGGPEQPVILWYAVAVSSLPGRFTTRGIVAGVAVTLALLVVATAGADPGAVADQPSMLVFPAALVVSVALFGWAHMHSEVAQRAEAVMDPLTQMLNRKALVARVQELAQQTALTGRPIGLVLGDLDHFKAVNDRAGHQIGDAVLRDVAFRWRLTLRAYEMAYRLGGEEFVVLLPGSDLAETAAVAERLRRSVGAAPVAGQAVTMSFGVAASAEGEPFDFDALYRQADAALYRAKDAGRDRVGGGPPGAGDVRRALDGGAGSSGRALGEAAA